jgi:YD repeat-containing protein
VDRLSGSRTFDLDRVGRVTAVHAPSWTERYAYDDAGNQTSASWPSGHPGREATGSRAYTGTTLTRAGDVRFSTHVLTTPAVQPGGLRADAARDFRLQVTRELCRAPDGPRALGSSEWRAPNPKS